MLVTVVVGALSLLWYLLPSPSAAPNPKSPPDVAANAIAAQPAARPKEAEELIAEEDLPKLLKRQGASASHVVWDDSLREWLRDSSLFAGEITDEAGEQSNWVCLKPYAMPNGPTLSSRSGFREFTLRFTPDGREAVLRPVFSNGYFTSERGYESWQEAPPCGEYRLRLVEGVLTGTWNCEGVTGPWPSKRSKGTIRLEPATREPWKPEGSFIE